MEMGTQHITQHVPLTKNLLFQGHKNHKNMLSISEECTNLNTAYQDTEITQSVREHASKHGDRSSIPRTHMMKKRADSQVL